MPTTLQTYFATATKKIANDLIEVIDKLPEDKRGWSPNDKGRTALDQAAECAILNGVIAEIIATRAWVASFNMESFASDKAQLAQDWTTLKALLLENAAKVVAAIEATPDEALDIEIAIPWGKRTLAEVLGYPYWNMAYHEGQTTYIGTIA